MSGGLRGRGLRRIRAAWVAIALTGALASPVATGEPPPRFGHVVIDPGHGGDDEGAHGPEGAFEKDVVLDVARRLAKRLRARGLVVTVTRDDDRFVGLEERTGIANEAGGDLFVSIHANASTEAAVHGVETYFLAPEASDEAARALAKRENDALAAGDGPDVDLGDPLLALMSDLIVSDHVRDSDEFARLAHQALAKSPKIRGRGVKQAPFVVLMGLHMPAVLVEIGFLTHAAEGRALLGETRRAELALALERAVIEFQTRYDARRGAPADAAAGGSG